MSNLYEVIYVSHRSPGVTDTDVVDKIVLPAGRKNRLLDITGCLWFDSERFLQVLEGPRDDVERVYKAVRADDRHTDVRTITASPIASRSFDRWSMRAITGESEQTIEDLVEHFSSRSMPAEPNPVHQQDVARVVGRIRDRLARLAGFGPEGDPSAEL